MTNIKMNRKSSDKPRTFWLHFNRLNARRGDEDIWTVHVGGQDIFTRKVICHVSLETVFRGAKARQPRAYLKGRGRVLMVKNYDCIVIAP